MFACVRVGLTRCQRRIFEKQNICANDNLVGLAPARLLRAFGCGAANETLIREVATSDVNLTDESGKFVFNSVNYLASADNGYIPKADCERSDSLAEPQRPLGGRLLGGGRCNRDAERGLAVRCPRKRCPWIDVHPTAGASRTCPVTSGHSLDGRNRRYRHRRALRVQVSSPRGEEPRTPGFDLRVQAGKK